MSDQSKKNNRIRRVPESEKKGRVWPDKSQHASSYPGMLNPDVTKKNPIHSVITALPVIMLLVGLVFWYQRETQQQSGQPLLSESIELVGNFNGVSTAQSAGDGQFYLWLMEGDNPKTLRLTPKQYAEFQQHEVGDIVSVVAAPTVSGSSTLWVVSVKPR